MKNTLLLIAVMIILSCERRIEQNNPADKIEFNDTLRIWYKNNLAYAINDDDELTFEEFPYLYFDKSLPEFQNRWYSCFLYALEEYPLQNKTNTDSLFRFLILNTSMEPMVITLAKSSEQVTLNIKVTDGKGGYHSGTLKKNLTIFLNQKHWSNFKSKLKKSDFFNIPSIVKKDVADGISILLEVKFENKYHLVSRLEPGTKHFTPEIRLLCGFLIDMAINEAKLPEINW